MFGIGLPELIIIFVVALVVFGPKKLPDLAKSLGKGLAEFKKASDELRTSVESDLSDLKVDLKEETYNPEVASRAETLAVSETQPPELEGPPAEQPSEMGPYEEDLDRENLGMAEKRENPLPEEDSARITPPQKEENQAVATQESSRKNIG